MKVAIVGSRKRSSDTDRQDVERLVEKLNPEDVVISGGCRGVDSWAIDAAIKRGLVTDIRLPFIHHTMDYGKMVEEYYRRNRDVVDNADMVYAFVSKDGLKKGGTWYTIEYAKQKGKKVVIS